VKARGTANDITSLEQDLVDDAIGFFPKGDQDRIEIEVVEDLLPSKYRR
jgi:hypothetical protein